MFGNVFGRKVWSQPCHGKFEASKSTRGEKVLNSPRAIKQNESARFTVGRGKECPRCEPRLLSSEREGAREVGENFCKNEFRGICSTYLTVLRCLHGFFKDNMNRWGGKQNKIYKRGDTFGPPLFFPLSPFEKVPPQMKLPNTCFLRSQNLPEQIALRAPLQVSSSDFRCGLRSYSRRIT